MNPLTFPCVAWHEDLPFMGQKKQAHKSELAVSKKEPPEPQPWNTPAHDAALYPTQKWHLYLPKLSFDSLPHTASQITFNTRIKCCSKICLGRLEGRVRGMEGEGYIYIL